MLDLKVHLDGDGCWPDLSTKVDRLIHLKDVGSLEIAALDHGMKSGKPSVLIRMNCPEGRIVIAETSMRLFLAAARIFAAKFGDA